MVAFLLQTRKWVAFSTEPFPGRFPLYAQLRSVFSAPANSPSARSRQRRFLKVPLAPARPRRERRPRRPRALTEIRDHIGFSFLQDFHNEGGRRKAPRGSEQGGRNSPEANESEADQPKLRGPPSGLRKRQRARPGQLCPCEAICPLLG